MSGIIDFLKAVAGICETDRLGQDLWEFQGDRVTIKLDRIAELRGPGGAVYLKGKGLERPVLVISDNEGNLRSFSNRCTHGGRKLDPVSGEPVLRCCSVNHSTFDYDGNKLSGPAKKSIRVYQTELKDGDLIISI